MTKRRDEVRAPRQRRNGSAFMERGASEREKEGERAETRARACGEFRWNEPRAEIRRRRVGSTVTKERRKGKGRRRREEGEGGECDGGERDSTESALRGSVNATLKSAYKSLRRRFPSALAEERAPVGSKLVRDRLLADLLSLPRCRRRRRLFLVLFVRTLTLSLLMGTFGERESVGGFFCNRCVSDRRESIQSSRILSLSRS